MLLRSLAAYWSAALGSEAEYRVNFVLSGVAAAIGVAGSLFTLGVLYRNGHELGGWSWPEAMLVVAVYTLLDGVQQAVLGPNRASFTELVREGGLDYVLLKPLDAQAHVSLRKLSVWGFPNLVLGAGLVVYAGLRLDPVPGPAAFAFALLPLGFALVILYALGFLLATTTIWFTKADNITIAMQSLLESGRFPVSAYAPGYRFVFTFVVPAAFMTTVPAETLARGPAWRWLAGSAAVALGLLLLSRWFWGFALRNYTSASS